MVRQAHHERVSVLGGIGVMEIAPLILSLSKDARMSGWFDKLTMSG